ncbi:3-dehydroquinate synthase [Candidatus Photodesmus katoptron]|uniref:3-dehydroquinate synthase n=1 Tax=Candidatus Photodesmus katoptron Akat1 TaxID=1236703 RepID=S3DL10_9GAMM|nr:3-dehydroquinate synthase [Candidatus Photodesmus katoptron]EPE37804.1 3-dehydroquinate synthase [Candidatus Photodesmus katoptron Akat1]KEY90476.1 3-dehydroquinate synthase [Candidatus Photodesmus katoptron]
MEKIWVCLNKNSYPILIGSGLFSNSEELSFLKKKKRVVIISDYKVALLYSDKLLTLLALFGCDVSLLKLKSGEQYKNLYTFNKIIKYLLEGNYDRDMIIIALGGGVIGDLVGFSAACYCRGVDFIQMPTTLLAQVDSSIGGKTAVNHSLGKNMIGVFYQPKAVIIDTECLLTLSLREFTSGIAEVIKYSIICDQHFFSWLESHLDRLYYFDKIALKYTISCCCRIKAQLVSQDEKESDIRAFLNLGHTFGHAIESALGYGIWLHGEAVSSGIVVASKIAQLQGLISEKEVERIISLLRKARLPVYIPSSISFLDLMKYILRDKKVLSGQLRLVLPTSIGTVKIVKGISKPVIRQAVEYCRML